MQQIWNLCPSGPLADAVAPHLDRAGVSFTITDQPAAENGRTVFLLGCQDARTLARAIIEADGKEFVPETPGEYLEKAVTLGLFEKDTDWHAPLTRKEAALLTVRLLAKCAAL